MGDKIQVDGPQIYIDLRGLTINISDLLRGFEQQGSESNYRHEEAAYEDKHRFCKDCLLKALALIKEVLERLQEGEVSKFDDTKS